MKKIIITEKQLNRLEELRLSEEPYDASDEVIDKEIEDLDLDAYLDDQDTEDDSGYLFPNVTIDLKISEEIRKLVEYFPAATKGTGIDGLIKKIRFLSNPGDSSYSTNMQQGVNALIILNYLKKLRNPELFEASSSGFFFESFLAGLLNGDRQDISGQTKGATDILGDDDNTYSIKLYRNDDDTKIQIKSKTQKESDVTDYVIVGVKHIDSVEFLIYNTGGLTPKNNPSIVKISEGKWYIKQGVLRENIKEQKLILDYSQTEKEIRKISGILLDVVDKMSEEMALLQNDITQLVTISTDSEEHDTAVEEIANDAKQHAINLDKEKEGYIDKSVDILTRVSGGPE